MARMFLVVAALVVSSITPALAGIADTPLPTVYGASAKLVYSVPGVIRFGNLETVFTCTSVETANTVRIGVQLFDRLGASMNDLSAGDGVVFVAAANPEIPPGMTVTITTGPVNGVAYDQYIVGGGQVRNGSARILSTSTRIICTAMVIDKVSSPPASMVYLPVISKTKQKASN